MSLAKIGLLDVMRNLVNWRLLEPQCWRRLVILEFVEMMKTVFRVILQITAAIIRVSEAVEVVTMGTVETVEILRNHYLAQNSDHYLVITTAPHRVAVTHRARKRTKKRKGSGSRKEEKDCMMTLRMRTCTRLSVHSPRVHRM